MLIHCQQLKLTSWMFRVPLNVWSANLSVSQYLRNIKRLISKVIFIHIYTSIPQFAESQNSTVLMAVKVLLHSKGLAKLVQNLIIHQIHNFFFISFSVFPVTMQKVIFFKLFTHTQKKWNFCNSTRFTLPCKQCTGNWWENERKQEIENFCLAGSTPTSESGRMAAPLWSSSQISSQQEVKMIVEIPVKLFMKWGTNQNARK